MKKHQEAKDSFLLLLDPPERWIRSPLSVNLVPIIEQFAERVRDGDFLDLGMCGIIVYNGSYLHRRRVETFLNSKKPKKEEVKEEEAPQIEPALRRGMRPVTLEELVRAFHEAVSRITFRSSRRKRGETQGEIDVIIDSEEVRIEELMEEVYARIRRLSNGGGAVSFKRLILSYNWKSMTLEAARLKLTRILLCLLHLVSHRRINILQDEGGNIEVVLVGGG
ncbi:MAG: hypothetical protein QXW47_07400 [Candidatus Jordarchaeales archaeon]